MFYKIGIDVGGTNTDAAILDQRNDIIAKTKTPTTPDVTQGIEQAMAMVLERAGTSRDEIQYCMLGTTHCVNAILERSGLDRVAVIVEPERSRKILDGFRLEPRRRWRRRREEPGRGAGPA